jgi:alanine racemase
LAHNLNVARQTCPNQTYLPVIKANGYGHGLEAIAGQLMKDTRGLEGVAVAAMSEAQRLRDCGVTVPIILLPGFLNQAELTDCMALHIDPVLHSKYQVDLLLDPGSGVSTTSFKRFWLKANTGMNRLGMNSKEWQDCHAALMNAFPGTAVVAMSHLACADDATSNATPSQVEQFDRLTAGLLPGAQRSLAASGGILAWPQTHHDIVRPGIMLYGSSPFAAKTAEECGLKPVMTLRSRVIAINSVRPGDPVGYGESFVADKPMRIGVVSIGYGDGYPRQAPSGTPLLVSSPSSGGGMCRVQLAGRVSMDMITIDLTDVQDAQVGAEVVLWGQGLPAEEIATLCNTISYELFCQVTTRVPRIEV